jgi:putative ABC transport system substrate-binding protein
MTRFGTRNRDAAIARAPCTRSSASLVSPFVDEGTRVRRREFIGLVGGAAAWPFAARAQQPAKIYRIGYLSPITSPTDGPRREAFLQGLREHGYVEGQHITVEWRFAEGKLDQLAPLAIELVGLKVDLIVAAGGGPVARAVMNASDTIPIVMTNVEEPVASGLVASLARPGKNVTGLTALVRDLSAKRLELLREVLPKVSRVSVLWNPAFPGKDLELKETQNAAIAFGIQVQSLEIRSSTDIDSAFETATKARSEALVTLPDPLTNSYGARIIELAAMRRLPTMFSQKAPVDAGGLLCYGPSYADLFRRAATYVDKILKGAKPADLPIEQPTKFELVINLKTAKALGLEMPSALLLRADEVIE